MNNMTRTQLPTNVAIMAYFLWIIVFVLSSFCSSIQAGIYIPKRNYTFYSTDWTLYSDETIGVIIVSDNEIIACDTSSVDKLPASAAANISVELNNIAIIIRAISNFTLTSDALEFKLHITCANNQQSEIEYYQNLMSTTIILKVDNLFSSTEINSTDKVNDKLKDKEILSLCPANEDLVYDIIENTKSGIIDVLGNDRRPAEVTLRTQSLSERNGSLSPDIERRLQDIKISKKTVLSHLRNTNKSTGDAINLNTTSGELTLLLTPDREIKEYHYLPIVCTITLENEETFNANRVVTVHVVDVNDNPPTVDLRAMEQLGTHVADSKKYTLQTNDIDTTAVTNADTYRITTNDTQGVVTVNTTNFKQYAKVTQIETEIYIDQSKMTDMEAPYIVDITVEDLMYNVDISTNISSVTIHRLLVPPKSVVDLNQSRPEDIHKYSLNEVLDIASAKYSLVYDLGIYDRSHSLHTKYKIIGRFPANHKYLFGVTDSGNVYVNDTSQLFNYSKGKSLGITVIRLEKGLRTAQFTIVINVNNNLRLNSPPNCNASCSIHTSSEDCKRSCGYGAFKGHCQWRSKDDKLAVSSLCTPNKKTCPDGFCSDLEYIEIDYCPQDCNNETMQAQLATMYEIKEESCSCDNTKVKKTGCNCEAQIDPKWNTSKPAEPINPATGNVDAVMDGDTDSEVCNSTCMTSVTVSSVLVVILMALGSWVIRKRRRRRHIVSLKHVNSLVSMTAVPSDYIVDETRDMRNHGNRLTSSPVSTHWPFKLGFDQYMFEDKWEFPRKNLTLEHVIGEGEFGQVVRAQAFQLRGQDGTSVVAVKMLKPDASGAEYQDLVSEFQLLKEVSHPNVIQLLGVCTQKGPLYVIVEYCELGSLRNFLRLSKFKNKVSWEEKMKIYSDSQTESDNNTEARILTCRDFFSFAWQIAKGMDYLAGLKIVHRDLAARNVLVTGGMKMKISDFGLSRDVYEADTYLKMSKGRIPVKWMAPESLYGQIYTTKSDIWSFGIVLWEIITLGASPYPGIPPERLFPLLSTGYRMDRPDECPDELYAIMQKCWKLEPEDRPYFSALRDILDKLLTQNTEYLDLSDDYFLLPGTNVGVHTPKHYSNVKNNQYDQCPNNQQPSTKLYYSNIFNPNYCPPNVYVTNQFENDDIDSEDCPELHKLLHNKESNDNEISPNKTSYIIKDDDWKDDKTKTDHIILHENLTYV